MDFVPDYNEDGLLDIVNTEPTSPHRPSISDPLLPPSVAESSNPGPPNHPETLPPARKNTSSCVRSRSAGQGPTNSDGTS